MFNVFSPSPVVSFVEVAGTGTPGGAFPFLGIILAAFPS